MSKVKFGARLRMARKAKGITANDVAELADIASGDYYSRYERGIRTPPPETMIKLCKLFDVTPNFLYADDFDLQDDIAHKFSKLQPHEREAIESLVDQLLDAASKLIAFEVSGLEDIAVENENIEEQPASHHG